MEIMNLCIHKDKFLFKTKHSSLQKTLEKTFFSQLLFSYAFV